MEHLEHLASEITYHWIIFWSEFWGRKEQKPLTFCHTKIRDCCQNMDIKEWIIARPYKNKKNGKMSGIQALHTQCLFLSLVFSCLLLSAHLLHPLMSEHTCSWNLPLHYSSLNGAFACGSAYFGSDSPWSFSSSPHSLRAQSCQHLNSKIAAEKLDWFSCVRMPQWL